MNLSDNLEAIALLADEYVRLYEQEFVCNSETELIALKNRQDEISEQLAEYCYRTPSDAGDHWLTTCYDLLLNHPSEAEDRVRTLSYVQMNLLDIVMAIINLKYIDPKDRVSLQKPYFNATRILWNTRDQHSDEIDRYRLNRYRICAGISHEALTDNVSNAFMEIRGIIHDHANYSSPAALMEVFVKRVRTNAEFEMLDKLMAELLKDLMEYKKNVLKDKRHDAVKLAERSINLCLYAIQLIENSKQEKQWRFNDTAQRNEASSSTIPQSADGSGISLDQIIGLDEVKRFLVSLEAQLRIRGERIKMGLPVNPTQTLHMIFTGNPGTGKTTIARYVSQIFHKMGVLKTNILVETDRSGLIAGYVGQTALKTRERVEEALDGILFIDEAYALANDADSGGFGKEAIDTLVKCIDDYRDRLVVILAGYAREMEQFLETNPGLKSRFPTVIDFPDYSVDELMLMTERMFDEQSYVLTEGAKAKLRAVYAEAKDNPHFGNGRFARNLFEKALRNQAMRLNSVPDLTKSLLVTIEEEDIG